ncbi:MAG: PAS domain-containing protein [Chloracidobacterium sp.]
METQGPLVHLVDDDAVIRQLLGMLLREQGLEVVTHSDGLTALGAAAHLEPDIVLLDISMPGMDGITLCGRLRQLDAYRLVPILMLTGISDESAVEAAFAAGATDYILKPPKPVVLKHRVSYLLQAYQAERQLQEAARHMHAVVQYASDAILTLDNDLRILTANPMARQLMGSECIGQRITTLVDSQLPLSDLIPRLVKTGESMTADLVGGDGRRHPVELTCSEFYSHRKRHHTLIVRNLANRGQVEQELEGAKRLLNSVINTVGEPVAILSPDGTVVTVNTAWRRTADTQGMAAGANYGIGMNYLDLCDQADPERYPEAHALALGIRQVAQGEKREFSLDYPCQSPDAQRWFRAHVLAGPLSSVMVIHEDITPRHTSAGLPFITPQRWMRFLSGLPHGLAMVDGRGRIIFANNYLTTLLGEPMRKLYGQRGRRYLSHQGWSQFKTAWRQLGLGKLPEPDTDRVAVSDKQEVWLRKPDGCLVLTQMTLAVFQDEPGLVLLIEDLTPRQTLDEVRRRHNEEWLATVDALPNLILLESTEGNIRRCNHAVAAFLGLPYPAIIHQSSAKLFFGQASGSLLNCIQDASAFQFPGDNRWFQISSYWITQERGIGTGWVHVIDDITARRLVEQDTARLIAAIERVGEGVVTFNRRGRIIFCNPAFEHLTGIQNWEAIGRRLSRLGLGPVERTTRREILRCLARGQDWRGQYLARRRDGSTYYEEATVSPVHDASGAMGDVVMVCRDVTEQRRYEAIAEAVNVTENAGYIFSAIRHEMGNPINSIKTALTVLRRTEQPSPSAVTTCVDRCLSEIGRVEYLLRTLRSFSLHETPELKAQPLVPFLERFCALIADGLAARQIALERAFEANLGLAWFDERALHQALMNLISNAIDALATTASPRIVITAKQQRQLVVLTVYDNGVGIDTEQQKHLFRPFYTSKPQGTGLGLVITQRLISKMKGTVELQPHPAGGCEAIVTLEAAAGSKHPFGYVIE